MARPRTASNILDARGAFAKNPQRRRPDEPQVETKFPAKPPKHLSAEERLCWHEIVKTVPAGVLTGADVIAVEVVAVLLADFREVKAMGSAAHLTRMTALMGRLGMDPSGRASLVVKKPKSNPFDDL